MSCRRPPIASVRRRRATARAARRPAPRGARRGACAARCTRRSGRADRERAHLRAEERSSSATSSAARGRRAAVVTARRGGGRARRGCRHEDADQLEPVAEPPAELRVVQRQGGHERRGEPDEPDCDSEVGRAACEQERPQCAHASVAKRTRPTRAGVRAAAVRLGHARQQSGRRGRQAEREDRREQRPPEREQRLHAAQAPGSGKESARIAAPAGSVAPPVNMTTLFVEQEPGVASPCRASSAAITANAVPSRTVRPSARRNADDRQRHRGGGCRAGAAPTKKFRASPGDLLGREEVDHAAGRTARATPQREGARE